MRSNIETISFRSTPSLSPGSLVLLAEEDPELRGLLTIAVESDGHGVQQAADGKQMMEWLAYWSDFGLLDARCNLIIVDAQMPGYTGFDLLKSLNRVGSHIPIVVITNSSDNEERSKISRLGAAAVLSKPLNLDDVRLVVMNLLNDPNQWGSAAPFAKCGS